MSVSKVHMAICDLLDSTGNTACSGIRRAGVATPCYVYEVQSMELAATIVGAGALNHWTVVVEVQCVADTVSDVCTLLDDLIDRLDSGPINSATRNCSMALSSFQVAFSTATPDDGQQDAERVGTVSMTLLIQED